MHVGCPHLNSLQGRSWRQPGQGIGPIDELREDMIEFGVFECLEESRTNKWAMINFKLCRRYDVDLW